MKYLTNSGLSYFLNKIKAYISSVLPTKTSDLTNDSDFIDSNNLKTINNNSLVGTGNITITANSVDWDNVNNKPSTFTPSSHTHSASDITSGLATVATSGSYNDLSNKPTIPTVNNATLTIQKNGSTVKTFTANASSNVTANISVPTKVSQLTNDSGFITGVSWDNVSGKPSSFTPSSHTHTKSQITDFPSLATVATSGSYSDLSNRSLLTVNGATSLGWSGIGGVANGSTLQLCTTDNTSPSICFHRSGHSHVVLAEAGGVLGIQAQGSDWLELATKSWVTSLGYITSSGSCNYANSAGNSDTLDGYHEYSFLRYRGGTSTSGEGTLWAQIGIKDYNNALPDGLSGVYSWGEVVSLAGGNGRFDIYCSHNSSNGNGLYYRSGWADDKKDWRLFIDSANIGSQSVNYANSAGSAGSVAWDNVSGRPWAVSQFSNDSGYITTDGAAYPRRVGGVTMNFNWSGQGGQPTWLWGGEDGTNMYVYNPANFSVNHANSAGYADSAGSATNATYTNWLRTSSHSDHLLHIEWDGSYFWTYVTAGDGGYRAVRVERSNSSGYADSAGGVAWTNVSGRPWALSQFTNDSGFLTSHQDLSGYVPRSGGAVMTGSTLSRAINNDELRLDGGAGWGQGASVVLTGKDNGNFTGYIRLVTQNGSVGHTMSLIPDGGWVWDGAACQITSDQRLKQQISEIDDKLLDAWEDVDLVQFKYNDAVDQKGKDKARLHTGYVVQQIDKACKSHGVDVSQYGLYCHEEYPQETEEVEVEQEDGTKTKETKVIREASEHYSLRYTETLVVECAYLRKQIKELKERLEKLEGK